MRRLLLTVCAVLAAAIPDLTATFAQTAGSASPAVTSSPSPPAAPAPPAARLIKPRAGKGEPKAAEKRARLGPIDERCKPLKQQLDSALARSGNPHKTFQARLARNAGTRLCRDGQVQKGMAELRKGLSYLDVTLQP